MSALMRHPVVVQARREFWEHGSLWIAPLIAAGLLFVSFSLAPSIHVTGRFPVDIGNPMLVYGSAIGITAFLGMVTGLVLFSYLLDCLYAERKDRSILFWKSLPVSDVQTVLAKAGTGLLVAPLLALAIAAVAFPVLLLVLRVRYNALDGVIGLDAVVGAYGMLPRIALTWMWGLLWYAPFAAYLLLASALAKRVPLLHAVLQPVVLVALEGVAMGTTRIAGFIARRLAPWGDDSWSLGVTPLQLISGTADPDSTAPLLNTNLWLGVAAAAVMVYIVIRLRRYRDDT